MQCIEQDFFRHRYGKITSKLRKFLTPSFRSPYDGLSICDSCDVIFNYYNKSSAVAEMGDRGHNRHGPKRGGPLCPFRG